jgi:hypothetical protein
MNSEKLFALLGKILLLIVALTAIGISAYYLGTKTNQKQTALTQEQVSPTITQTADTVSTPTIDETQNLINAIKAALHKKYPNATSSLNVTVSKIEGEYAKGMVTEQGGGGMWFAAKQNGFWTLVWDGNGVIKCTDVSPFPQFPKDMIPECFDDKIQNTVKR